MDGPLPPESQPPRGAEAEPPADVAPVDTEKEVLPTAVPLEAEVPAAAADDEVLDDATAAWELEPPVALL
jgi:hypothetical protein